MLNLFLLTLFTAQGQKVKMNPSSRMFVDPNGRSLIFHGVNVVVKVYPFVPNLTVFDPQYSLAPQDITNLKNWGFNFVRLGVMWEAVETSFDVYNTTYLNTISTLINSLGAAGIYTLIDNHQDVYARKICGEGVPDFYAQNLSDKCEGLLGPLLQDFGLCIPFSSFNYSVDSNGDPLISNCTSRMFATYYATPQAADGFSRIYSNKDQYQDRFIQFWNVTSKHFANNPYVVGYDLINEPLAANMFTEPWTAIPGVNDHVNLQRLYENTQDVIRENDNETIIFFEPIQGDLLPLLGGMVFPIGFNDTPGGAEYLDRVVLNDHSYCCQMSTSVCASGEPPLDKATECAKFNFARVTSRAIDARDLGVGLMITEFGACFNTPNCVQEIEGVTGACDDNLAGWAYWMFKEFGDFTTSGQSNVTGGEGFYAQSALQTQKVKALARTYVQAYQGVPISLTFNPSTGYFHTVFTLDPAAKGPTVLFASDLYYPTPPVILVTNSENLAFTVTANGNYYSISFTKPVFSLSKITINSS